MLRATSVAEGKLFTVRGMSGSAEKSMQLYQSKPRRAMCRAVVHSSCVVVTR